MELISEPLPGVRVLRPFVFEDARGNFVKPFHEGQLAAHGIEMTVREEFFSTSAAGVLRGMHFQVPPHAHQKLVYCISGRVLDVVLDLRRDSPGYGRCAAFELSAANHHVVHIPVGLAHGFLSLEDQSCLVYKTDAVHAPDCDAGILWNSFGFDWPVAGFEPVISPRDQAHPRLSDFSSPF
ncbi:dTDP-4-dehydrorhamnose 3,5-epimerase [Luteolibacter marinus]|uniref:dTDP-4-dehydrorhamnose 3,5-epimerase n=1 Tax=Luteolibacter marinus TaxID=2776705 RepID=UPI001865B6F9|nr:dTDP-4-dehydrorhamnose 3,5-epimerase [Luteolibacter marinus]